MKTQNKLQEDLKKAMLAKDEARKSIIRVMLGELARIEKILSEEAFEQETIARLKKMQQNAIDLKNDVEYKIISEYLPTMLTEEELEYEIEHAIANGLGDIGSIMAHLKKFHGNLYDGKRASEIIRTKLN